jgi:hypothetical protein
MGKKQIFSQRLFEHPKTAGAGDANFVVFLLSDTFPLCDLGLVT